LRALCARRSGNERGWETWAVINGSGGIEGGEGKSNRKARMVGGGLGKKGRGVKGRGATSRSSR